MKSILFVALVFGFALNVHANELFHLKTSMTPTLCELQEGRNVCTFSFPETKTVEIELVPDAGGILRAEYVEETKFDEYTLVGRLIFTKAPSNPKYAISVFSEIKTATSPAYPPHENIVSIATKGEQDLNAIYLASPVMGTREKYGYGQFAISPIE